MNFAAKHPNLATLLWAVVIAVFLSAVLVYSMPPKF